MGETRPEMDVTTGAPFSDNAVRPVVTEQLTSISETSRHHVVDLSSACGRSLLISRLTSAQQWMRVALVVWILMQVVSASNGRRRTLRSRHMLRHHSMSTMRRHNRRNFRHIRNILRVCQVYNARQICSRQAAPGYA